MSIRNQGWDEIFATQGKYYDDPYFPRFPDLVEDFQAVGVKRILDLGCGTGRHAAHFARFGMSTVGTDIAWSGLTQVKDWEQALDVSVPIVLSDMCVGIPFASESFDAVFSSMVIYRAMLEDIRAVIAEIYRVLKPGGRIFIAVSEKFREQGEEIAPNTYVPIAGDEKGVPHYIFTEESMGREFSAFELDEISHRANGVVMIAIGRKPLAGE